MMEINTDRIICAKANTMANVIRVSSTIRNPTVSNASAFVAVSSSKVYKGDYEAIPKVFAQTFDTKGYAMRDDFKVTEIPTHKSPNDYGTTFTIGD